MNTEISDEIQPLIEDMREVEKRNRLFMNEKYIPVAYEKLDEAIDGLYERLNQLEPQNKFDELIIKDIEANVGSIHKFADFYLSASFEDHNGSNNQKITVKELFDDYYGEGSFEYLKGMAESHDGEKIYEAMELKDELDLDSPEEYRDQIISQIDDVIDQMTDYANQNGIMPEDFEFEKSIIPAHIPKKGQRASWMGKFNRVNLSAQGGVYVIRNNGDVDIDMTSNIFTIFHELAGHGVHQWNSSDLQYPKNPDNVLNRPATLAHLEGVSQHREELAKDFIEDRREELPVREEGMKLREIGSENKDYRGIYASLVKSMHDNEEIEEEEMREKIDEVYRKGLADRVLADEGMSIHKAIREGAYASGERLMREVNANQRESLATSTGVWHPKVFPEAVEYFEKEMKQS